MAVLNSVVNPILQVDSLGVALAGKPVLSDIAFTLGAGDIVTLLGANGAGKTTLLRCMAGDRLPGSGSIQFASKSLTEWKTSELAQQLAVLPQFNFLEFSFSVAEVVAMGCTPHAISPLERTNLVASQLAAFGLTDIANEDYQLLSGGEQQRVHLARVFAQLACGVGRDNLPKLLLLDEPTSSLDYAGQQLLAQAIQNVAAQGVAVMLVCHDINFGLQVASHALALKRGRLLAKGEVASVLSQSLLAAVYDAPLQLIDIKGKPCVIQSH